MAERIEEARKKSRGMASEEKKEFGSFECQRSHLKEISWSNFHRQLALDAAAFHNTPLPNPPLVVHHVDETKTSNQVHGQIGSLGGQRNAGHGSTTADVLKKERCMIRSLEKNMFFCFQKRRATACRIARHKDRPCTTIFRDLTWQ